ncbi:type VI secretion system tip protein VgrG [Paraburkholderia sp. J76]|uniref:type VI secretion system Vgr family protein n=1 Tax=Paraburkholderia sp. J76 TaxID=2805439 RepID=UPI002ABD8373|nr:type VI secretion system tip protein VgrG [Paraburkholderia sp. J76]
MGVNEAIGALRRDGLQAYHVDIPGSKSAPGFDVVDFDGVEEAGVPTRFRIKLTHRTADLPVEDILTKTAVFPIRPRTLAGVALPAGPGKQIQGVITGFNQLSSSRDETTYEVILESRIALLRNVKRCRIFLGQTDPEIAETILREHGLGAGTSDFEFTLRREYPKRDFVMQWNETDLGFITRLARRSGIWFVIRQGEYGEVTHFGDDFTHYERSEAFVAPFRPASGLESTGAESVEEFETRTKTIAQAVTVRHYNHRQAPQPIDGEANAAPDDKTTWGTPDVWAAGHLSDDQAEWEAQLRHEALLCEKIVYTGTGNVLCVAPGRVFRFTNRALPDAEYGQLVTRVEHSGSRKKPYRNTYTAIPSHLIYRMALLEGTWPKIHGTVSGRITSPDRYKYAYVNKDGHVMVAFDFDRDERTPGLTSCWMRVAKPFAGAKNTGLHFPNLDGAGVEVAFENGNPDFPYVAHIMHDSLNPDVITSDDRWMTRNVIHTQSNNTLQMEDFEGEEHVKLATEGGGKAQLNLGNMVDSGREKRGSGAEFRTDDHAAIRGGKGVLISGDEQTRANGHQLDNREAMKQLQAALDDATTLRAIAEAAQAELVDVKSQQARLENAYKELKQSIIMLSAPHGIVGATPEDIQFSSGRHLTSTAGGNAEFSIAKKFIIGAGEVVSVVAQKIGILLFAIKGKIQIQAQGGPIEMTASGDVIIKGKRVILAGQDQVLMSSGGGAYYKVAGSVPEVGGTSNLTVKTPSISKAGAASVSSAMPSFQQGSFARKFFLHPEGNPNTPISGQRFRLHFPDGTTTEGVTDDKGMSQLFDRNDIENLRIEPLGASHE